MAKADGKAKKSGGKGGKSAKGRKGALPKAIAGVDLPSSLRSKANWLLERADDEVVRDILIAGALAAAAALLGKAAHEANEGESLTSPDNRARLKAAAAAGGAAMAAQILHAIERVSAERSGGEPAPTESSTSRLVKAAASALSR